MKKNGKIVIGFMIGIVVSLTGVYAAEVISSSEVSFDNKNSNLESTNVQDALDEVYTKITTPYDTNHNIVVAYQYDSSKCVIGEESTCKISACYGNRIKGSCSPGTIIKYKVNDTEEKYFYVLHDDGKTMTLQQRENTIDRVAWYLDAKDNRKGPLTALEALEDITNSWNNVNTIDYTMGTTNYKETDADCQLQNGIHMCTEKQYTLEKEGVKARMATYQEAMFVGCSDAANSCPIWMLNYLSNSTDYGGTVNVAATSSVYWLISSYENSTSAVTMGYLGRFSGADVDSSRLAGARAVVVISK